MYSIDLNNIPGYSIGCLMGENLGDIHKPLERMPVGDGPENTPGCWTAFTPMNEIINALQSITTIEVKTKLVEINSFTKCE